MHRTWKKRIAAILLTVILAVQIPLAAAAGSLEDARQEKEKLENALEEAQQLISGLKGSKDDIQDKVTELDAKLTQISGDITELEAQLEEKNTEIADTRVLLAEAKEEEKAQYESMKLRIRYMYENRNSSYMQQLILAENFGELLNAVEYIRQISQYDRAMLDKYKQTKHTVTQTESTLEQDKEELKRMQEKVKEEQQAVQALLTAKENELASVNENITAANSAKDAVEAEIQAQNEIIAQIQQAEAAKKAARKAAAEKAAAEKAAAEKAAAEKAAAEKAAQENDTELPKEDSTEGDNTQESNMQETEPEDALPEDTYNGGAFVWPCPSSTRVTSDYGNRISPTAGASSNHKGIDIGAAYGADIVAAADGTVIFSGYSSGGGNYVMIDHGGSLYTVYMHASSLCVSKGDTVKQGQLVAKVGSTGISTGNHLHFGVSLGGSYVSPWNYLSK